MIGYLGRHYLLGVIARIFGHTDTRTTARYLGLDLDDMSSAMYRHAHYQKSQVVPKTVQIEAEPEGRSGPKEIPGAKSRDRYER